jgi:hypothetical protein
MLRRNLLTEPLWPGRRSIRSTDLTTLWSYSGSAAPTDLQMTARVVFHVSWLLIIDSSRKINQFVCYVNNILRGDKRDNHFCA